VSESGCRKREQHSALEALWALGALEPKKRLKRPDTRVGVWWKGCQKQPPKAPFSAAFSQIQRLMWIAFARDADVSCRVAKRQVCKANCI
jgi:hypothetical protein